MTHIDMDTAIAVTGLACRFPGASNPDQFWQNLCEGVESITFFSNEELREAGVSEELLSAKDFVPAQAIVEDVAMFDAAFFSISPKEADIIDPQHRILLECAWNALEDGATDPNNTNGPIGIFAGASRGCYLPGEMDPNMPDPAGYFQQLIGNNRDFLATFLAYKLNLRGPAINVLTACSTSLVAIHMACQSLLNAECDSALAGGACVRLPQTTGYRYNPDLIFSPDGHCRAFDADAHGVVSGNGAGMVLLKRLQDAIEDGDHIRAVIRGSAINNDGKDKIGYTAPSIEGQESVIAEALAVADVTADTIGYIEAHGTGTPLGDPIEIEALTNVYREHTDNVGYCRIGSVKTNFGHLDSAAGVAGFIKAVLVLEHGVLPPSLHYTKPNPRIDFASSPFQVQDKLEAWPETDVPRRAGISSFGIGGTNAHVILEQAPVLEADEEDIAERPAHLLMVHAKTKAALPQVAAGLAARLRQLDDSELGNFCYSVNHRRARFTQRIALVATDRESLLKQLDKIADGGTAQIQARAGEAPKTAFLFSGQGSQYAAMGQSLYLTQPRFREVMDQCNDLLGDTLQPSLLEVLWGDDSQRALLDDTTYTQVALFALQVALAELWREWGVEPEALLGHSVGEYAAAHLAGVFSLEDGLRLIAARARLMGSLPAGGAMSAAFCDAATAEAAIANTETLALAAVNGPKSVVLSGVAEDLKAVCASLNAQGIKTKDLVVSGAFHSPLMDPVLAEFKAVAETVEFQAPELLFISNLTGAPADERITTAQYWVDQVRQPVRFAEGMATLQAEEVEAYVEIGPAPVLLGMGRRCLPADSTALMLPSLRSQKEDNAQILESLGTWLSHGGDIDWHNVDADWNRTRLSLPTYPFQRRHHWSDQAKVSHRKAAAPSDVTSAPAPAAVEAAPVAPAPTTAPASVDCEATLREIFAQTFGFDAQGVDLQASFFLLGFDSLMLIRLRQALLEQFSVDLEVESFYKELDTPAKVVTHLEAHGTPVATAEPVAEPAAPVATASAPVAPTAPVAPANGQNDIEALMKAQLATMSDLMEKQLAALNGSTAPAAPAPAAIEQAEPSDRVRPNTLVACSDADNLSPQQQQFVDALIQRYNAFTGGSKAAVNETRDHHADWLNVVGYRHSLKEMHYPIIAATSKGARFTDLDGNNFLDIAMGYGVNFLGHAPDMVNDAVEAQLDAGYHLGPQSEPTGDVAELLCRMTGCERVSFTNSGTEAVMAALRIARTVTGRQKVAIFSGAFHGTYDGVLANADKHGTFAMVPGVLDKAVEHVVVLDYGTPEAIEAVRAMGDELAAVIVEPVQSRRPGFHPKKFLQNLRTATSASGTALIFDEIITGFRIAPGGAQAYFDVRADMVTYGKVIGGGLPIGVLAGSAQFMDAVDGGQWQFGDDSKPQSNLTMLSGTFCKHPLAMAATRAVLRHLEEAGQSVQDAVNQRTDRLAETLNAWFEAEQVPVRIKHFGSLFRFESFGPFDLSFKPIEMDLLFFLLMERGIYTWERRICFLSTCHTDADIDTIIDAVKDSILALRSGGFPFGADPNRGTKKPVPTETSKSAPMSSHQQRLYSLCQTELGKQNYHFTIALNLEGKLDVARFDQAVKSLYGRHESLRTSFHIEDDGFVQRIEPQVKGLLETWDAETEDRDALVSDFIRPFDLETAPLARFGLARLSATQHFLVIDTHHLINDGLSFQVIMEDLMTAYADKAQAPVKAQYVDFANWEANYFASPQYAAHREFWSSRFADGRIDFRLPMDFSRDTQTSRRAHSLRRYIDGERLQSIRQLAQSHSASTHMVLLAAFNVWLSGVTGEEHVVVGGPADLRPSADFQRTVGMFVNNLVLRNQVRGEHTFAQFLEDVKQNSLASYSAREFPFNQLVHTLGIKPEAGRNPLYDVQFIYERLTSRSHTAEGLTFSTYDFEAPIADLDLMVEFIEENSQIMVHLKYPQDLLRDETVQTWVDTFLKILDGALAQPEQTVAELRGDTHTPNYARSVVEMFENAAASHPDAIALVADDISLTYGALNTRANQLAHRLQIERGLGNGDLVGILAPPGAHLITAMLAVNKCGAAYVPLDPENPPARIATILEDAGVKVLLDATGTATQSHVMTLGDHHYTGKDNNPRRCFSSKDPAYVIYTSGTTGKPKGVVIPHRALLNYANWATRAFELGTNDRTALVSSHAYDLGYTSIWGALCAGSALYLTPTAVRKDADELRAFFREQQITFVKMTPSLLSVLLCDETPELPHLRLLVLGGEPIRCPDLSRLREVNANIRLYNHYGPSEATIGCIATEITDLDTFAQEPTIGRPIPGANVVLIDAQGKAASEGEIAISGVGLALGYWNRPQLSAEKFAPLAGAAAPVFYRTGDLGRRRGDGHIIFKGRVDDQVKVNGYRIEPAEIAAVLQEHADVSAAAVVAFDRGEDGNELVAYIAGTEETDALRTWLADKVPAFMLPTFLVALEELPVNANGKLDRTRLQDPRSQQEAPAAAPVETTPEPTQDPLVEELVGLWKKVLKQDDIGPTDDFFARGGHSIKGVLLVSAVRRQLKMPCKPEDLFTSPTPVALAETLRARSEKQEIKPIPALPHAKTYALSRAQMRLWLASQTDGGASTYSNYTLFRVEGNLDESALGKALDLLVERHDIHRAVFIMEAGEPRMRILPRIDSIYAVAEIQPAGTDAETAVRKAFEAEPPFDLERGPLLRARLYRVHDERYLVFANHHLISDGWSTEIFISELFNAYRAYTSGATPNWKELRIQYQDYAAWHNDFLAGKASAPHRNYWQAQLADLPAPLEYATDQPRQTERDHQGAVSTFEVPTEIAQKMREAANAQDITLFMFVQAALKVLLFHKSGATDITVGAPIAGRIHPDLENQIGFYVNMLPLRNQFQPAQSFADLLNNVKQTTVKAYAHEAWPFDLMVEEHATNTPKDRHPLFDVMLNFGSFQHLKHTEEGPNFTTLQEAATGSKMDLSFVFRDGESLTLHLGYATALFNEATIQTWAKHLIALLEGFATNPGTALEASRDWLQSEATQAEEASFLTEALALSDDF